MSDIGVQPKGGYADIEVIEEESPAVTTLTRPVSKKEAKKREKEKEMKAKKGEFEDGTKMTPTQKEFFEKKATLASKESKSSSSKSSSSKHAKKADDVEKDKVTKKSSSSSSSSSSKKETAEEKMIRLQQEKIDLLEKEVEETKEANAEKEAKQIEEAEREKEQLELEEQEKKELEKAKKLAKEKKNVGAFFDWGGGHRRCFTRKSRSSRSNQKKVPQLNPDARFFLRRTNRCKSWPCRPSVIPRKLLPRKCPPNNKRRLRNTTERSR